MRGDALNDLVLTERKGDVTTFHDQTDFIFEGVPGHVFDSLKEFNEESFENKMVIEHVKDKYLKLTILSEDEEEPDTVIKVKFFTHEGKTILTHFQRKSGNILNWYTHLNKMKETSLDFLGTPNLPI